MTAPANNPLIDAAMKYAARGWRVLPLHAPTDDRPCDCVGKSNRICASPGKHPRILKWQEHASTDPAVITKWWTMWPTSNIGIATGPESGIMVIDIDLDHGGEESFAALEQQLGSLDVTLSVRTGAGGRHIYLRYPPGVEIRNRQSGAPEWQGVDVRGINGYVCAPPSLHASGNHYRWIGDEA